MALWEGCHEFDFWGEKIRVGGIGAKPFYLANPTRSLTTGVRMPQRSANGFLSHP